MLMECHHGGVKTTRRLVFYVEEDEYASPWNEQGTTIGPYNEGEDHGGRAMSRMTSPLDV